MSFFLLQTQNAYIYVAERRQRGKKEVRPEDQAATCSHHLGPPARKEQQSSEQQMT